MHIRNLPHKAAYLAAWKRAKANPDTVFLTPWPPGTGREHLAEFRRALDRRINQRGGLPTAGKPLSETRLRRALARTVRCECRWCGTRLPYATHHARFCDGACRHSYFH
jgi:hypothetical protein